MTISYSRIVTGTNGSDLLFGGSGNDLLTGGAGSDVFAVSNGYGSDTISDFQAGVGGDVLRIQNYGFATFASFVAAAKQVGADTVIKLSSTETLTLQSVTLSNLVATNVALDRPLPASAAPVNFPPAVSTGSLTTGATNDRLQASGTSVTLIGGAGDDTYTVYDHNTAVIEQAGQGVDTVVASLADGFNLLNAPNVENLILSGTNTAPATGNELNNIIVGNAGDNRIDGGYGNDVLTGGGGSDTFVISQGKGSDLITDFHAGPGGDVLQFNGTGFKTFADVTAAMKQLGTDVVVALGNNETLTLENTTIKDIKLANVSLPTMPTGLVQTFNDDFNSLSAGQDPNLTWRTSYAWGGAAGYKLPDQQGIVVDSSFTGLPGTQASAPLGLDPFSIQNGHLIITAQPIPAADAPYVGGAEFSTGVITTENSFSQTYGYFQMTATLTDTKGAWPAFWLLPSSNHYPAELDVMESFGQDPEQSHWAVHSALSPAKQGAWVDTSNLSQGEHTFGVEWTPYTLTFFVDGQQVGQTATPADMNTAMYMIANLAMGGTWPGNADPGSTATMTIDSITAYQLPEYTLANYTLLTSGTPTNTVTGSSTATTLAGTDGNDLLTGGSSSVAMSGGAGDDTYIVTSAATTVVEGYGGGVDTIISSVTYALPTYVENLTLTGTDAINATGNSQANILIGNSANNVITGGWGNDILTGQGGSDTFVINFGDGSDVITDFIAGSGAVHDVVQLNGFAFTSFDNVRAAMTQVGNDVYLALTDRDTLVFRNQTISSFTSDDFRLPADLPTSQAPTTWINGIAKGQTVYGSAANNQIATGGSGETLVGGDGDDTYVVGYGNINIIEKPNQGVDTVLALVSYTLPANVENLTLKQPGLTGTGNSMANRITGSSGSDTINGGGGDDWLFGGAGNDKFVYAAHSGHDTIADFHPYSPTATEHDTLVFQGYGTDAYLTNVGDEWTIHYTGGTDTIRIVGVTHMSSSDYSFVSASGSILKMAALPTPTVDSYSPDSGVQGDGITNAKQITLAGHAAAGTTVEVFDGGVQIGTTVADSHSVWNFATPDLIDGTHAFTGVAADGVGDSSATSAALNVTIDTTAPTTPVILSETQASPSKFVVSGTAEAGSVVTLFDGSTVIGSAFASTDGIWKISLGSLPQGTPQFSAIAMDEAGNITGTSSTYDPKLGASTQANIGESGLQSGGLGGVTTSLHPMSSVDGSLDHANYQAPFNAGGFEPHNGPSDFPASSFLGDGFHFDPAGFVSGDGTGHFGTGLGDASNPFAFQQASPDPHNDAASAAFHGELTDVALLWNNQPSHSSTGNFAPDAGGIDHTLFLHAGEFLV